MGRFVVEVSEKFLDYVEENSPISIKQLLEIVEVLVLILVAGVLVFFSGF